MLIPSLLNDHKLILLHVKSSVLEISSATILSKAVEEALKKHEIVSTGIELNEIRTLGHRRAFQPERIEVIPISEVEAFDCVIHLDDIKVHRGVPVYKISESVTKLVEFPDDENSLAKFFLIVFDGVAIPTNFRLEVFVTVIVQTVRKYRLEVILIIKDEVTTLAAVKTDFITGVVGLEISKLIIDSHLKSTRVSLIKEETHGNRPVSLKLQVIKLYIMGNRRLSIPRVHGRVCKVLMQEIPHGLHTRNINTGLVKHFFHLFNPPQYL
jgi:hypothetical protein